METKIKKESILLKTKLRYEDTPWSYSSSSSEEKVRPYKIKYIQKQDFSSSSSSSSEEESELLKLFEKKISKEYYRNQCKRIYKK